MTVSNSLAKIKENPLLLRFVVGETIPEGDGFCSPLPTRTRQCVCEHARHVFINGAVHLALPIMISCLNEMEVGLGL